MPDELNVLQEQTISVLRSHLAAGERVALLDFPNHQNSGDSLIWLGERQYLARVGVRIVFACDILRYDRSFINRYAPGATLLLHGGGNLGDRWIDYQDFRERVITDFPDRKIVQLSQSIEFTEGERLDRAVRIFSDHPNFSLLLRDSVSIAKARRIFPEVSIDFCPDLALGYGRLRPFGRPATEIVVVKRRDSEAVFSGALYEGAFSESAEYWDWGLNGWKQSAWRALHVPGGLWRRFPASRPLLKLGLVKVFDRQAMLNVGNAIAVLSRGHVVVTDRLHSAVLAMLMDKPVVVLDNANGKISAIFQDYLGSVGNVRFANDVSEASELADNFINIG
ncbi:polysaccharide pyruvyl transferase family protein [Rhodococcus gordoniae]|uniref:polysaccharide pyruvyl transferase family protein n=1 Tax=Rhodococcus gordoniae TaxID=223392 RepID=UPI0020CEDC88|nr:polysaccharide pyruvyl transferase family protein [Rhodococcus gordoniae]UTT48036.1 polysaccharide pyruvyl transferase family protein [Rhodococcus gordoniae]